MKKILEKVEKNIFGVFHKKSKIFKGNRKILTKIFSQDFSISFENFRFSKQKQQFSKEHQRGFGGQWGCPTKPLGPAGKVEIKSPEF